MDAGEKQNWTAKRPRTARRFFAIIHLWLGLTLGALFSVTGLTGSVLVFYQEIDARLTPQLASGDPHAKPATYEALYAFLTTLAPATDGYWSIELPAEGGTITSRFMSNISPERRLVSVDPARLVVLRDTVWGGSAMTWLYDLHQQLLLPQTFGRSVMGTLGVMLLVLVSLGIVIWWPKREEWRDSLTLSHNAPVSRRLLEFHQIGGAYFGLFLGMLAATGAMIGSPDVTRSLLSHLSSMPPFPIVASQPAEGLSRIPMDRAMAAAQKHYPQATIVWIDAPNGGRGVYQVRMRAPGEPSPRFPRTYVWLDQYTGNILASRTATGENAGDVVLTWLHPLHNGEAFGLAGRLVVLALGFLPLTLFVTGLWRWLSRSPGNSTPRFP
jgi:uncharacterized iron-regulated membrane protein